jgi:hypothetical protein
MTVSYLMLFLSLWFFVLSIQEGWGAGGELPYP